MKPDQIAAKARKMIAGKPELEAAMRAEWEAVQDKIEAHIGASKKKWKVYEASQITTKARLAMLTAFIGGKPAKECA
ncbi:hypothetical protein, partial [Mesorhizobium sp. M0254]|uniref:hypothetical protein n=1 Tax=Mesorhizobium sp. M0254 TaxID=2956927 RepID=UPI00333948FB